eukprot:4648648-Pyramimonas_sp.AAC.1
MPKPGGCSPERGDDGEAGGCEAAATGETTMRMSAAMIAMMRAMATTETSRICSSRAPYQTETEKKTSGPSVG